MVKSTFKLILNNCTLKLYLEASKRFKKLLYKGDFENKHFQAYKKAFFENYNHIKKGDFGMEDFTDEYIKTTEMICSILKIELPL